MLLKEIICGLLNLIVMVCKLIVRFILGLEKLKFDRRFIWSLVLVDIGRKIEK